jgi:dihydroxy-acid dehydratase
MIAIDIPRKKLELIISTEEIENRRKSYIKPEPKITKGYLGRYSKLVTSANTGAVLK